MVSLLCISVTESLSFLIERHQLDLEPNIIQYKLILTWLHLQRLDFQIRLHSGVSSGREFWGDAIQLIIDSNPFYSCALTYTASAPLLDI